MIPPTPEASGEPPLSDVQLDYMIQVHITAGHWTTVLGLRELQQRRAASLPAAQGGDVAVCGVTKKIKDATVQCARPRNHRERHESANGFRWGWCGPASVAPSVQGCRPDNEEGRDDSGRDSRVDLRTPHEPTAALDARLSPPQEEPCDSPAVSVSAGSVPAGSSSPTTPLAAATATERGLSSVPPPQGAPEASVDLEQLENAARSSTHTWAWPLPLAVYDLLAALQRARETGAKA